MEILTGLLNEEHRQAGLELEQVLMPGAEDDLICLKRGDKVLDSWPGRQAMIDEVIKAADNNLCPLKLIDVHCYSCIFSKEGLCDWPHGLDGSKAS